ncbi:DNA repair protein (rad57)-like protein [Thermochaetoides thermophila DSM 1495]|uniref:DNA repair protein (Rad57)-like protein n=1 Tax=Chaetomium thermophilum (strain DSM 1495 / CBS 144.50 / IMI 039719) TaxID=759272 RepID=G0RY57_CHATD|nr:DNA repair protein (rad57)-like protein [Thermochaetoides thermophila DSM 1495]EGS23843.1 DNA repair protein (rad57)-like protein [Thermochaetoides thermophila DSM 1495]
MTDLLRVLPHFPIGPYARLLPVLEQHGLTTSDLLTLEAAEIGKRTHLPLLDIKRLCDAVLSALHADLGVVSTPKARSNTAGTVSETTVDEPGDGVGRWKQQQEQRKHKQQLKNTFANLISQWHTISTLDPTLDAALSGGIPIRTITEITGESGTGKTQFLLTLLLSVQLPPPHGLGRPAMYISTEAPLPTRRLSQMLSTNPVFQQPPRHQRPSLDRILSTSTPDLESQDHILTFQVPVEIERRNVGLLVLDSVAANYRAEFERAGGKQGSNMGARTAELVRLGMLLRELALKYDMAVVVANQVADRFPGEVFVPPPVPLSTAHRPAKHPRLQKVDDSPLAPRSKLPAPEPDTPETPANIPPPSSVPLPSSQLLPTTPTPNPAVKNSSTLPSSSTSDLKDERVQRQQQHQPAVLLLDHQQRWFTGWGDTPSSLYSTTGPLLKTPSLGLVWTTQLGMRIALFRKPRPAYGYRTPASRIDGNATHAAAVVARDGTMGIGDDYEAVVEKEETRRVLLASKGSSSGNSAWRRWMKVVFASHVAESGPGVEEAPGAVEFEVWMGGLRAVQKQGTGKKSSWGK